MRLELGYPSQAAERALLKGRDRKTLLSTLEPCIHPEELASLQETVTTIHVSDALLDCLQALIAHSRHATQYQVGLSPRAGIALLRCTQAWALMSGRSFALPEDLQTVLPDIVGHRLIPFNGTAGISTSAVIDSLLARVPIP